MGILGRLKAAMTGSDYVGGDLQKWLDECADMGDDRCAGYSLFEEFYNGDHRTKLRDRARAYLEESTGIAFCENFAEPTVDTLAERLEVVGFTSSEADEEAEQDPFADVADEWWQQNRMDATQKTVHTQALMKGDDFLIAEWDDDEQRPRFIRQRQHQMKVVYNEERPDELAYAVKVWNTREPSEQNGKGARIQRMNLYWPDRIEKWYRPHTGTEGKGGWEVWTGDGDNGTVEWMDSNGEPLGVPVVHFRHKPLGNQYGRSRVKPVIPFQLELNKAAADLNDLCDSHGLPQRWASGVSGDMELEIVAGNVWSTSAAEARFGQFEAAATSNLLDAIEGILSRLARRSRVPMHLLTGGTPPSGESLKTSESGLVATAKDCQIVFGNSWEDLLVLGFRLAATFGGGPELPEGFTIEANWNNPETRSDKEDLETALLKKQLGVSNHTLLREAGYDPERELEMSNAEKEADAEIEAKAFDAGSPLR